MSYLRIHDRPPRDLNATDKRMRGYLNSQIFIIINNVEQERGLTLDVLTKARIGRKVHHLLEQEGQNPDSRLYTGIRKAVLRVIDNWVEFSREL